MNNKKIGNIRKKIDLIDASLLNLIGKRTKLVDQLMKVKKNKSQIVDKKRIKEVLKKIRNESIKKSIDLKVTKKIWKNFFSTYVEYQKRKFRKK